MDRKAALVSLAAYWKTAAADLGIEVVTPFDYVTRSRRRLRFVALVRGFGPRNGMVIPTRWLQIADVQDELWKAGYGFSVMSDPRKGQAYVRENVIDVLADWGWNGAPELRPSWLADSDRG